MERYFCRFLFGLGGLFWLGGGVFDGGDEGRISHWFVGGLYVHFALFLFEESGANFVGRGQLFGDLFFVVFLLLLLGDVGRVVEEGGFAVGEYFEVGGYL